MTDPYRALARREPVLAGLVRTYGRPDPFEWFAADRTGPSRFAAMVVHIVGQQISTVVAFTLYDRVVAAGGGIPTPERILALGPERLRACGLSRAKVTYLLDLAGRQAAGTTDVEHMDDLTDTEAIAALTEVRGVGLWSAQMFLIYQLGRADVLPAGDVGIRNAIRGAWGMAATPAVRDVLALAQPWAPYRSTRPRCCGGHSGPRRADHGARVRVSPAGSFRRTESVAREAKTPPTRRRPRDHLGSATFSLTAKCHPEVSSELRVGRVSCVT